MDIELLVANHPRLYHNAERGSWESIRAHGLLSTSALLDQCSVSGEWRYRLEAQHRPELTHLSAGEQPGVVIRYQKPMDDTGLERALCGIGMAPSDWYHCLNRKVFFWASEQRLHRLLNARAYRRKEHDVLTIDTRSFLAARADRVLLCPINSGCTKPIAVPRDSDTFLPIKQYPWDCWRHERGRPRHDAVVEVCVEGGVLDVADHVLSVYRMRGLESIEAVVPPRSVSGPSVPRSERHES